MRKRIDTAATPDIGKNAEEHLVQMEGRYRGLLEATPDAMAVVVDGRASIASTRAASGRGHDTPG